MRHIDTERPVSEAPPAANLIPLVPPGMKNEREKLQADGKIVAKYTNLDGTPFMNITRDPADETQKPRVYIQPNTPLEVAYVIRGKADEIILFGPSERGTNPKIVEIEGEVDKLSAFGHVYIHVKKALHVSAEESHIEADEKIETAVALNEGVIHGKSEIKQYNSNSGGHVYTDRASFKQKLKEQYSRLKRKHIIKKYKKKLASK